jgi:hypothetical protein
LFGFSNQTGVAGNAYYNAGWKYKAATSNLATRYEQNSAGTHSWFTASSGTAGNAITFTQAMTLTATGNLGIGVTSPSAVLHTSSGAVTNSIFATTRASGAFTQYALGASGATIGYVGSAGQLTSGTTADFAVRAESNLVFASGGGTERARIDSSGNLLVGTTSNLGAKVSIRDTSNAQQGLIAKVDTYQAANFINSTAAFYVADFASLASAGDNLILSFSTDATPATRGSVTYNRAGGVILYNTTSDYRAKDIAGPVTDSGALIDSTPVYMGKMKGATQERPMFIAHEVPTYAHTGEKDAVDKDGNPVYQQMDASALIPVMWAEIQSLRKRLADAGI